MGGNGGPGLLRSTAPHAYTTPPDLLDAWYLTKMLGLDDVSFGPYSDAACTTASSIAAGCECNEQANPLPVPRTSFPSKIILVFEARFAQLCSKKKLESAKCFEFSST